MDLICGRSASPRGTDVEGSEVHGVRRRKKGVEGSVVRVWSDMRPHPVP